MTALAHYLEKHHSVIDALYKMAITITLLVLAVAIMLLVMFPPQRARAEPAPNSFYDFGTGTSSYDFGGGWDYQADWGSDFQPYCNQPTETDMDVKDLFRSKNPDEIARIKKLVETIDQAEAELAELVGSPPDPVKRGPGRPPKPNGQSELPIK